jgi:hypothetical protein
MKKQFLSLFAIVSFFFFAVDVDAQERKAADGFGVEMNFLAGKVVKHTAKFTAPIPSLTTALDINLVWQTYGKKDWEQRRNFPVVGVGVTYTDYGNNQVFGNCLGVYPNIQMRLIRRPAWEWTMRIGDGLGYVTKKYQKALPVDTLNTAIGSHLNDFAILMMDFRYHINKHWHIQYGLSFTHISNAGTEQPNLGVNTVAAHLGVMYFPVTFRPKPSIRELPRLPNRWLLEVRNGISYKEARATGSPVLPTYMSSVYASRRWLGKNKYFFGVDGAFHNDVLAFLNTYCDNLPGKKQRSWDGAVFGGNELLVGRFGIVTQLGVYYKQTYLKFDPVYEKIGGNFYFINKESGPVKELFISALLLTHSASAELAEFGVGVGL